MEHVFSSAVELEASPMTITVDNETSTVELNCEMSQYVEPDSNLQWFRHGSRIAASEKYNISYEDGNKESQMGGSEQQSSRVSTLVISDFQEEDKGFYHCNITGTENSEAIYISLGEPGELTCLNIFLYFSDLFSWCFLT